MEHESTSSSAQTSGRLDWEALSSSPSVQEPAAIAWRRYSGRISYSSCNEDSHSELEALRLAPDKRVLCVTAGGGRVLNLLFDQPREIVAVDVNPTQNHLLELKIEAMRAIAYEPYLAFLGVRQARDRLAVYQGIRPSLSSAARDYFDTHPKLVQRGVLFQGSLERFLVHVARIVHVVRPFWVKRLFSFENVAEQRRFIEGWNTRMWRFVVETMCRRSVLELFSRDPGFWRFVPPEVPLHSRIFDSIHRYLCNRSTTSGSGGRSPRPESRPSPLPSPRPWPPLATTASTPTRSRTCRPTSAKAISARSWTRSCEPRGPLRAFVRAASSCIARCPATTPPASAAIPTSNNGCRSTILRWCTNSS